jgi:light-regulated signal transduction histidine kinase (bacteriophytochrome)
MIDDLDRTTVSRNSLIKQIDRRKKTEQRLKTIMEELTRSNQELEQFAYITSHDLQEPLRMVTSYVTLLEKRNRDKLDSDSKDFINFAVDGTKRMQQLINDLLTYSRVGTRGKPFTKTNCKTVMEKTIKNLEIAIKEKGAKVSYNALPTIIADEAQIIQLFQNLIGNAIKFCQNKPPKIKIRTREDDDKWIFGVQDNGIGIAPEFHERIFQIFQRLHTRQEYKGTGIGLAVSKRIVDRHGGKIWVDSKPGKGTTFWFTIPKQNDVGD